VNTTMKRLLLCTVVLAMTTAGCGGRQSETGAGAGSTQPATTCEVTEDTRISIATGNQTGVYYPLGNAYATQISAATGDKLKATAAETGASVQNIQQVVAGTHQVAFSLFDSASDAVAGKESFETPQPVQALARIYDNFTQVVVRADAGINSVADMKGKRISTGSPRSGTEVIAQRLLRSAGLDPDTDIDVQRLDLTKTVDGMKDGSIDGMFWSGGLPTAGITDLFTNLGERARFLDITPLLPKMQALNPAYQPGTIPASTYKTAADTPTIVVPNVLLVRDDLDADIACVLTRVLLDKKDELVKVNAAAKGIDRATAGRTDPVPLHPGAAHALGATGGG
jgi:uncharacterized protein